MLSYVEFQPLDLKFSHRSRISTPIKYATSMIHCGRKWCFRCFEWISLLFLSVHFFWFTDLAKSSNFVWRDAFLDILKCPYLTVLFALLGLCLSWWYSKERRIWCSEDCFQQVPFSCLISAYNIYRSVSWGNKIARFIFYLLHIDLFCSPS